MRSNIGSSGCVNIGYKRFWKTILENMLTLLLYFTLLHALAHLNAVPTNRSSLPLKLVYFTLEAEKCKIDVLLADLLGIW